MMGGYTPRLPPVCLLDVLLPVCLAGEVLDVLLLVTTDDHGQVDVLRPKNPGIQRGRHDHDCHAHL